MRKRMNDKCSYNNITDNSKCNLTGYGCVFLKCFWNCPVAQDYKDRNFVNLMYWLKDD